MADIFGRNPVIEALRSDSEINKIYLAKGELQGSAKEIVALAQEKGVQIQTVERAKLDQMFPKENHQGVAASIAEANYAATFIASMPFTEINIAKITVIIVNIRNPRATK